MAIPREAGEQVARRIRFYRRAKEWSVERLAAECALLGASELTKASLWNIERRATSTKRQRRVAVEELLVIAQALGVPPLMLASTPVGGRCGRCSGAPPPGFSCNTCGRTTNVARSA
jgi:transcriptional regulator with XRE-family HTH domain